MSLLKEIYSLEPECYSQGDFDYVAALNYKGNKYYGVAFCHEEDKDYSSQYIGFNIASSRALIELLKEVYSQAKQEEKILRQAMCDILGYGQYELAEVDPTGRCQARLDKAHQKVLTLRKAIKKEEVSLDNYIRSVENTIRRLKAKKE